MSMDTIVIKACLNGDRGREDNPNVPWTPQEVAEEAVRCHDAGASIVHIHARTPEGGVSHDPDWYAEADRLIRDRCDLVLNHTTARAWDVPVEAVTRYLLETPQPVEMVSLNLGYDVNWPVDKATGRRRTSISPNSYEDIRATLDACYARGIMPEPAVQDIGHLNNAFTLMKEGAIRRTDYFLVEPSGPWGDGHQGLPSTSHNYFFITDRIREFYPKATWVAHGSGLLTFGIVALAIATGAHVRVGFEDSPWLPNNPQPRSNADLVEWAVTMSRLHGREPATPAQARENFNLIAKPD